ncbi:hypothetical protein K456DRAFT_1334630 [Colletotrichum gloeosporioides 23]|nr:hypothetical protein K456DRAFT_1334630 [Colletotrichum gloeosporioides 23]
MRKVHQLSIPHEPSPPSACTTGSCAARCPMTLVTRLEALLPRDALSRAPSPRNSLIPGLHSPGSRPRGQGPRINLPISLKLNVDECMDTTVM